MGVYGRIGKSLKTQGVAPQVRPKMCWIIEINKASLNWANPGDFRHFEYPLASGHTTAKLWLPECGQLHKPCAMFMGTLRPCHAVSTSMQARIVKTISSALHWCARKWCGTTTADTALDWKLPWCGLVDWEISSTPSRVGAPQRYLFSGSGKQEHKMTVWRVSEFKHNSLTLETHLPPNLSVMHMHATTHNTLAAVEYAFPKAF